MKQATERSGSRAEARATLEAYWVDLYDTHQRVLAGRSTLSADLQADLTKYLAIRMAGFAEQACYHSISGWLAETSTGPHRHFSQSWFKRSPNLTPQQLYELMKRFGESTATACDDFLDQDLRREVLSSLMTLRNSVAHGGLYRGSMKQTETYMALIEDLYVWFQDQFLIDDSHSSKPTSSPKLD